MLTYTQAVAWLNANEGVLAVVLFSASAGFAWFSGIISALRRRPKLKIEATLGPTLCAILPTGREQDGHPTHRVSISLYLHIANAGSAPTSIGKVRIGYRWPLFPFESQWWTKTLFRHWIHHQTVALADFQAEVSSDGDIKIYPFLTQRSAVSGQSAKTYLEIGEMTNGVVYFEEPEAWGGCQPTVRNGHADLLVEVEDAFGGKHRSKLLVPVASLDEAKRYNPRFGDSLESVGRVSAGGSGGSAEVPA